MPHSLPHTVEDEWIAAYSAGTLTSAKQLLLDCQAKMRPSLQHVISISDSVAGALLESSNRADLSGGFHDNLRSKIDHSQNSPDAAASTAPSDSRPDWIPAPLAQFMDANNIELKWRFAGPGVQKANLATALGERLYLLRAKAGFSVPAHGHSGQEWTLVLTGGYHANETSYVEGDLHQESEQCEHALQIDDDGPCISLIMDEGRLNFSNPLLKILQPIVGI